MARLWLRDDDDRPVPTAQGPQRVAGGVDRSSGPRSVRPVTGLVSSNEEDGVEPSPRYPVPRHVTPAGRQAFHDVMRGWAVQLAEQMEIDAQRARQTDPEFTAIQVHDARRTVERQNALRPDPDRSDHRVLAAILLTVGTVGVGCMTNFLVGPWQVVLFSVLVVVAVAGLILTWTGRSSRPSRDEP